MAKPIGLDYICHYVMDSLPGTTEFVTPVLRGGRFDAEPLVPLELLSDFSAYEKLLVEVAKAIFLAENPGRKKVPDGFAGSFELALTAIQSGSTRAVLSRVLISAVLSTTDLAPTVSVMPDLFDAARDKVSACITAVANQGLVPSDFPPSALPHFRKFGASLRPGESLELVAPGQTDGAKLTPEVRSILMAAPAAKAERLVLTGTIVAVDAKKKTFDLESTSKHRAIPYHPEMHVALAHCLSRYLTVPEEARARVTVSASRDLFGKINILEAIHISPTDGAATPIAEQLLAIQRIEAKWLDGEGRAVDETVLAKMQNLLTNLPSSVRKPNPYVYPMPDGGVRCEWDIGSWKVAALMEPDEPDVVALTALNRETRDYHSYDITDPDQVGKLAGFLLTIKGRVG